MLLATFLLAGFAAVIGTAVSLSVAPAPSAQTVDDRVIQLQPPLAFSATSSDRPTGARVCSSSTASHDYFTYIYTWSFSESPPLSERLGYSSHSWDFEPVIVRIDKETGELMYVYDSGHYRAGVAPAGTLYVSADSHRYSEANELAGETLPPEKFTAVTDASLAEMNSLLDEIPRLPFGPGLSLDWACEEPERAFETGYFSSDDASRTALPLQVTLLIGLAVALTLALVYGAVALVSRAVGFNLTPARVSSLPMMFILAALTLTLSTLVANVVYLALMVSVLFALAVFAGARAFGAWWSAQGGARAAVTRITADVGDPRVIAFVIAVAAMTLLVF